jgi:hypothetical protein
MNSWKVILATMVIFGTGVLTGGMLVRNTAAPARSRPARNLSAATNLPPPNVAPAQLQRMEFLLRVRSELNLSAEQHERIEKIIHEGQERSRKIWETVAPEMRKELQAVHDKIRAELSPEQRRRFEALLKRPLRPNPNAPEGNRPAAPERPRERMRPGGPEDPQPDPGATHPLRRENQPPAGGPPDAPAPKGGE